MKKLLLIIGMLFSSGILLQAQKPVEYETAFGIKAEQIDFFSKNGIIDSTAEAMKLIDSLLANPKIDNTSKYWLINHKEKYNQGKTALVIVQHKISFENTRFDSKEKKQWQRSCDSLNSLYIKLKVERKLTDSCRILLQQKITETSSRNTIDILNFYQHNITELDSAIAGLENEWKKLQPAYSEGESVYTYVHYYDKYASNSDPDTRHYTAYLQGRNIEIRYLVIGKAGNIGKPGFSLSQQTDPAADELSKSVAVLSRIVTASSVFTDAELTGETKNKTKADTLTFTENFKLLEPNALIITNKNKMQETSPSDPWETAENIRARVAAVNPDNKTEMSFILSMKKLLPDSLESEPLKKIPAKFISFKDEQLHKNDKINMSIPGNDNTYSLEIHKTKSFSLRGGMFGSMIERKLFQLDDSAHLYIQDDTLRGKKFWTNGFLILEFYPSVFGAGFHNDPSRLGPVWRPNPMVPWYYSRFGIYGGCRLSLKPQEAFVTGLSFILMDDLHLHLGAMAYQMPDNQNGLKVSSYGDAAYWKENAPYSYKWYFSFGLSLSPSAFLDMF